MGKDLHKCVAVIHRDILLMWSDYPQPDMVRHCRRQPHFEGSLVLAVPAEEFQSKII
jgi:hypothetical protein